MGMPFIIGALVLVFVLLTISEFFNDGRKKYLVRVAIFVIPLGVLLQIMFKIFYP